MSRDELLLGIDAGTTNVKAVLATPAGRVVAQASRPHRTSRPRPGWAEQNPEDWWDGTVAAVRDVMLTARASAAQVWGIGISGQGCGVTLVDDRGNVVRPAIIWMDTRAEPQCEQLRATCGDTILETNGKQPAPYNADPVLIWLQQHEPASVDRARCSLTTTGYLNFRLTREPVQNVSDASILFAFDLAAGTWSDLLIDAFGLPRKLYPHVVGCTEQIGGLGDEAAAALGLRPGTPVVAGGEDTSSAGLAIGVVKAGQALLSLGTAGTVYVVQEPPSPGPAVRPPVHPQLLAFLHVLEGQTLLGGSMAAVGAALQWCRDLLLPEEDYVALIELAEASRPGADGLIFLPYLSGELQPINDGNARGVFFGLSMSTGRPQMVRAVMEGAAFAIAHNLDLADQAGTPITELRAVGGPARSPLWCQIIADVAQRPVAVLGDDAGAPLGDALLAAAGVGLIGDPASVAHDVASVARTFVPREEIGARYQELFDVYRRLYPQLREPFAVLATANEREHSPV